MTNLAALIRRRLPALLLVMAFAAPAAEAAEDVWADLRFDLFGDRPIREDSGVISLEAPYRAEDAALVPITVRAGIPQDEDRYIRAITLVIDQNPAPVAATFRMTPLTGSATLSTRVRVNAYTDVRAIAETSDGELHMTAKFVKASGGCSAPALKDQDQALARLGQLKLRQFAAGAGAPAMSPVREAQLMIRHPNYSGLQMDQLTRLYLPAHFVREIEVRQGAELVLRVEAGISLSEDPNIRFHYRPSGAPDLSVVVKDSDEKVFRGRWKIEMPAASGS